MALARLSGAKSLRDPLVSQLLGEWVASYPLAKARWYEATEVAQLPVGRNKQIEAVKQYASVLFPAPEWTWLLMDLIRMSPRAASACVRVHDPPGGHVHRRNGPPIPPPHPFT